MPICGWGGVHPIGNASLLTEGFFHHFFQYFLDLRALLQGESAAHHPIAIIIDKPSQLALGMAGIFLFQGFNAFDLAVIAHQAFDMNRRAVCCNNQQIFFFKEYYTNIQYY
jgi:hypothetical protein